MIDELINFLSSVRQPQNTLTNQVFQALQRTNPPVYVVPDDQMPRVRYGEEVPRQNWQQALSSILGALQVHRAQNPVYIPFKPGTPTQQRLYQQESLALQRELGYLPYQYVPADTMLKASLPDSSETKYTKDDYEADLYGLREYYASAKDYRASLERNATEIIRRIGKSAYNRLLEEAKEAERQEMSGQLKWVRRYQVQGDPIREYFKMIGG
jgi:hypothetical protein